ELDLNELGSASHAFILPCWRAQCPKERAAASSQHQNENFTVNWNCLGFSMVLGKPKVALGFAGINSVFGGAPGAGTMGVEAKLPTPGMTKASPTGQAVDAACC